MRELSRVFSCFHRGMIADILLSSAFLLCRTQRIPRYLLLLRDLLSHTTPQSLSHARVQRGLETLKRVAMLCDHAQTTS